ncbi:PQ-loop domain-containing transporter [Mycoplasma simbae]|uniref:PQ-loop domain-containing transporter n=1 Tax=Mycoplasma simbae TaxID=36744 RepID=UPI000495682A|nr:PQ-loop domain-containing transporter [Mycoplasma simbae]
MDSLLSLFTLNKANPVSAWFAFVFGLGSVICTVSVGIPQLVNLLKTKKTPEGTNFVTFWVFFSGIVGWMLIGAWDPAEVKMSVAAYANIVSAFILSYTIFFSYKYSDKKNIQKKAPLALMFSLGISTLAATLSIWALVADLHMPDKLMSVMIVLFPLLTTLSFLPVVFKSLEQKKFQGMSPGMLYTLLAINIFWMLYWITLAINRGDAGSDILTAMVWQTLALLIYSSQVYLLHMDKCLIRKRILRKRCKTDK